MRRKNFRILRKKNKNICSALLLTVCLFLQTAYGVSAGANEVVKDGGAEECVEIQLPVEKQQQFVSEDEIISVSMPLQTPFTMNPTKSFGEEQIWSPSFHFRNNSRTAVEVTVKNIRYTLKENSTVITHYQPFDQLEERKKKEIYLCLRFGETEVPVGDLSREYRFTLAKAGTGARSEQKFSIEGMMSCYPEEEWQDGDVSIAFQVEYKAVLEKQTGTVNENGPGDKKPERTAEKKPVPDETAPSENLLAEVRGTEWQKNIIGAVLTERDAENLKKERVSSGGIEDSEQKSTAEREQPDGAGNTGGFNICAYIMDSGRTDGAAGQTTENSGDRSAKNGQTGMAVEESGEKEEFSFDWQKILDDYGKYADAIPEGAVLLLDVNEAAESPAAYVVGDDNAGLTPDMQNTGDVYAFWRNPDYVPEENKVWHIENDVPYYISNPEQPWLWALAGEDVPPDAEPVFMWIKRETDGAYLGTERNAAHGPENNTSDMPAE